MRSFFSVRGRKGKREREKVKRKERRESGKNSLTAKKGESLRWGRTPAEIGIRTPPDSRGRKRDACQRERERERERGRERRHL
jgi:hypothetical protein